MEISRNKLKVRWGMAIDLDKCNGCGACAISCSQENNLPMFEDDSDMPKRVRFLELEKVTNDRDAKFPDVKIAHVPVMCQQCEGNDPENPFPPCVSVCPVVATDMGEDGIVSQIWSRCIGCRYCQASCPYEARVFTWWKVDYHGSFKKSLNPDVSVPSRGVIIKCQFCHHIWKKERDKLLAQGETDINKVKYTPMCVQSCPTGAMVFGDLNDPESVVSKLAKDKRAVRLAHGIDDKPEEKQKKLKKIKQYPNPKVYYLSSNQWIHDMMRFK